VTLRLPDTGAETLADGRRLTPSAQRNAEPILRVLQGLGLQGRLLEIASGSGLHAAHMAPALGVTWQPSDVDPVNLPSIRAWATAIPNILPPIMLDATQPGWAKTFPRQDAILLVNLLHLIPEPAAACLLAELPHALAPQGSACLYGPFLRDGQATSPGDAAFDASLRAQDPSIGYKYLAWVIDQLAKAGMTAQAKEMPANNLMLIARHSHSNF
jgi:SAM-dependent methyltransferase